LRPEPLRLWIVGHLIVDADDDLALLGLFGDESAAKVAAAATAARSRQSTASAASQSAATETPAGIRLKGAAGRVRLGGLILSGVKVGAAAASSWINPKQRG
jgi:hypothetical protein